MILGAVIGFTVGIFVMGLIFLIKGRGEVTKTRIVYGPMARLAGVIAMIPIPLTFLIAILTKPQDVALFPHFIDFLISATGLAISIIGFVISLGVVYFSAEEPKAKNADIR